MSCHASFMRLAMQVPESGLLATVDQKLRGEGERAEAGSLVAAERKAETVGRCPTAEKLRPGRRARRRGAAVFLLRLVHQASRGAGPVPDLDGVTARSPGGRAGEDRLERRQPPRSVCVPP